MISKKTSGPIKLPTSANRKVRHHHLPKPHFLILDPAFTASFNPTALSSVVFYEPDHVFMIALVSSFQDLAAAFSSNCRSGERIQRVQKIFHKYGASPLRDPRRY
jgi:hypothetical protein